MKTRFHPFPTLYTARLVLGPLKMSDVAGILALRSNDQVNEFIDRQKAVSEEEARQFILKINNRIRERESLYWAIRLRSAEELIGTICLWNFSRKEERVEVGYELLPAFQGKGLMHEALEAVLRYGFETLGARTIEGWTHPGNQSSIRLLQKNGFKRDQEAEISRKQEGMVEIAFSLQPPQLAL